MNHSLGFFVNTNYCVGCKTCQIACKDKNDLDTNQLWRKVTEIEGGNYIESGYGLIPNVTAYWISMSCNHCESPKCVKACPTGASHKRSLDGLVLINKNRCIGCRLCEAACPYEARYYNEKVMTKCDACEDLLQQGKKPICVEACPLRVLDFGNMQELTKRYQNTTKDFHGLPDSKETEPNILLIAHRNSFIQPQNL